MQKPSIPKGTRDFLPNEMVKRNYIFDTIRDVFKLYGYLPIETPSMENLTTLLGKYGDEGDKLLFRVLNSGDFLEKTTIEDFKDPNPNLISSKICKKGLRYDLTVPFARFVVQYQNEISFPFKRYQIQPVWRADRPQKGRYREFYQCDADVVGSNSLLNELELLNIINQVFSKLEISVTVKLNNRKILAGIAEYIGSPELITEITVAIDKLEKVGLEQVNAELTEKGLNKESLDKLKPILLLQGTNSEKLAELKAILKNSDTGLLGVSEINKIFSLLETSKSGSNIDLDLTLARGLNYYTGAIIEVKANGIDIGSICGGGRYDDLTGIFGLKNMSGVGISFGADRIYDVMNQLMLFPDDVTCSTQVLIVNFGENEQKYCLDIVQYLRENKIHAEYYPDDIKLKKQMSYANNKNIPWVILIGEDEIKSNKLTCKNMINGEQTIHSKESLLEVLNAT